MKQCRLSNFNQVIEVFEKSKYDAIEFDFIQHEIHDCPDTTEPLMWFYGDGFHVTEPLESLKQAKYDAIQDEYQKESVFFIYEGEIFEITGISISMIQKTLVDFQNYTPESGYFTTWDKVRGSYPFGDNKIILTHANIMQFAGEMQAKYLGVYNWQDDKQQEIKNATTIEEIEAISTEYNG